MRRHADARDAAEFFAAHARQLGELFYTQRAVALALDNREPRDSTIAAYGRFVTAARTWAADWTTAEFRFSEYFGCDIAAKYQSLIVGPFGELDSTLKNVVKDKQGVYRAAFPHTKLAERADSLQEALDRLTAEVRSAVDKERIGKDAKHSCVVSARDSLATRRGLKSSVPIIYTDTASKRWLKP